MVGSGRVTCLVLYPRGSLPGKPSPLSSGSPRRHEEAQEQTLLNPLSDPLSCQFGAETERGQLVLESGNSTTSQGF